MKSILSIKASSLFLAGILASASCVVAECDGHAHNLHARVARAHGRHFVPRAHTSTSVEWDVRTTTDDTNTPPAVMVQPRASNTTSPSSSSTGADKRSSSATPQISTGSGNLGLWESPSVAFPDGTIPCSEFPSSQPGVVSVDYLGLGGWSGIQLPNGGGTAVSGETCTEGSYCSYACQPGMSKTQWPSAQPSDGETRGGLLCQNGMLHLTNPASQYLCEWGQQSSFVVNTLSEPVAICRTDYPGTENMVVPTVVGGDATLPLSCPDESTYFEWQGKLTSAQFYVNKAGGNASSQCLWGSHTGDYGNWAPAVFGAGYTGGTAWLSIMYNPLQTTAKLDYNVKIECSSGTMNGQCVYENGVIQQGGTGCTVACDGVCNFVLY